MIHKRNLVLFGVISLVLFLSACGKDNDEKIIGGWKGEEEDGEIGFIEFDEDEMTIREPGSDDSTSLDYKLSDTTDDSFMVEVEVFFGGSKELLFEGYFDNKDKIVIEDSEGDFPESLERVDDVMEEMEKEEQEAKKEEGGEAYEREDRENETEDKAKNVDDVNEEMSAEETDEEAESDELEIEDVKDNLINPDENLDEDDTKEARKIVLAGFESLAELAKDDKNYEPRTEKSMGRTDSSMANDIILAMSAGYEIDMNKSEWTQGSENYTYQFVIPLNKKGEMNAFLSGNYNAKTDNFVVKRKDGPINTSSLAGKGDGKDDDVHQGAPEEELDDEDN